MTLVGVTGTNGKTTTTHLVRSILEAAGKKSGMIGTIEYCIGNDVIPATHTTPESLELNELFSSMLAKGCSAVTMEVSSHALHQSRVFGLDFDAAVFTNLTQDHLDYHGTMEAYSDAKKILFDSLKPAAYAVVNADDAWWKTIVSSSAAAKLTYGVERAADLHAVNINLRIERTSFDVVKRNETSTVSSPLVGQFNVYNMLAAYGAGVALGIPGDVIRRGIENVASVRGRFEKVSSAKGWTAIIDYAHTPDALEKCLRTIHDVMPKQNRGTIFTVFGAGGDRDKTKRPLMGKIAAELSDVVVVTSDNPRTEDPEKILDDIIGGIPKGCTYIRVGDRRTAIQTAVQRAQSGDVVLVAGKGHEDYQVLGTTKIHFSDREIVEELALKAA
jgi:UDP-N-acetylmuramoyl-L-alanyl-D-glutamate--2,6-diaminopimelate ligase